MGRGPEPGDWCQADYSRKGRVVGRAWWRQSDPEDPNDDPLFATYWMETGDGMWRGHDDRVTALGEEIGGLIDTDFTRYVEGEIDDVE